MIVDNLDIVGVTVSPAKADSPLIVDANAVLPTTISSQLFQPIGRWDPEIIKRSRRIQHQQLSQRDSLDRREPLGVLSPENPLRLLAAEPPDHGRIVTPCDTIVKRYYRRTRNRSRPPPSRSRPAEDNDIIRICAELQLPREEIVAARGRYRQHLAVLKGAPKR